jgi:membrane-associated phospholipid phosphatase
VGDNRRSPGARLAPAAIWPGAVTWQTSRPTARLLSVYLAVTLGPLLSGGLDDVRSVAMLTGHCAALAAVTALGARPSGRRTGVLADWLPLLLIPFLYAEVPHLIRGLGTQFNDGVVQGWEQALFGGQPARTLAAALPSATLSEALHAAYLTYYPLIYTPPLILYLTGRRVAFAETVFVVILVYVVCLAAFVVFPVQGPRYLWSAPPAMPEGPVRSVAVAILERGSSRGAAFPSSHVAVAVAQALMAFRWRTARALVYAGLAAGLSIGAVYGGFHYATDVIAGAALGMLLSIAIPPLYRRAAGAGAKERAVTTREVKS